VRVVGEAITTACHEPRFTCLVVVLSTLKKRLKKVKQKSLSTVYEGLMTYLSHGFYYVLFFLKRETITIEDHSIKKTPYQNWLL